MGRTSSHPTTRKAPKSLNRPPGYRCCCTWDTKADSKETPCHSYVKMDRKTSSRKKGKSHSPRRRATNAARVGNSAGTDTGSGSSIFSLPLPSATLPTSAAGGSPIAGPSFPPLIAPIPRRPLPNFLRSENLLRGEEVYNFLSNSEPGSVTDGYPVTDSQVTPNAVPTSYSDPLIGVPTAPTALYPSTSLIPAGTHDNWFLPESLWLATPQKLMVDADCYQDFPQPTVTLQPPTIPAFASAPSPVSAFMEQFGDGVGVQWNDITLPLQNNQPQDIIPLQADSWNAPLDLTGQGLDLLDLNRLGREWEMLDLNFALS